MDIKVAAFLDNLIEYYFSFRIDFSLKFSINKRGISIEI